jgi:hypothetical protein
VAIGQDRLDDLRLRRVEREEREADHRHHLLAPLVVLVPSIATVAVAVLLTTSWITFSDVDSPPLHHHFVVTSFRPLAYFAIVVGLAISVLAGYRTFGPWLTLGTAGLAVAAGVLGLRALIAFDHAEYLVFCTKSMSIGWVYFGLACGALVFLLVGTVGFRARHPFAGILLAVILGVLVVDMAWSTAPGLPTNCSS